MDRERLLSHISDDERIVMARVLDAAEQALERSEPVWTDFLDPHLRELAQNILHQEPSIRALSFGGFRRAERQRLVLAPSFYLTESIEPALAFYRVTPVKKGELTHREVLGSLMGLGLRREKTGDILILSDEAQIIVADEVGSVIESQFRKVSNIDVTIEAIDPEALDVPPERIKEIRATVSSLRLDAVAGLGYGVSRTRMAREIKSERLKINWRIVKDPDYPVRVGDTLSIRGRGRVLVAEITGQSKKGRTGLLLHRYL